MLVTHEEVAQWAIGRKDAMAKAFSRGIIWFHVSIAFWLGEAVAKMVKMHESLKVIDLRFNKIGDDGAKAIWVPAGWPIG